MDIFKQKYENGYASGVADTKKERDELVEALEQLLSAPLYRKKSHPAEDSARALLARIKGE